MFHDLAFETSQSVVQLFSLYTWLLKLCQILYQDEFSDFIPSQDLNETSSVLFDKEDNKNESVTFLFLSGALSLS